MLEFLSHTVTLAGMTSVPVKSFTPQSYPGGKPRILAVDDQPDSLRVLQLRLESGGMQCTGMTDGSAALQFLKDNPVDVIILDVMMPGVDGFEVCRRIKANESTRDIPVLFLTAKMDQADKVRGLEVGGHDYLSKPVEQQELMARTRAALRVKQLQDQLKDQIRLQQQIGYLHQGMIGQHWQNTFGQLAASLAHEINNPLAAALGSIQLLAMEEDIDRTVLSRLQVIDESLQRAGQKLRSLLLIAHTHSQPQMVSLSRLVEDLLTLINFKLVVNKVALKTDIKGDFQWFGPLSKLARAVLYVLNNAIEAVAGMPEAKILIRTEEVDGQIFLHVLDNGPRVPAGLEQQIFEPFFTTKDQPHNGLGLYMAATIAQEHGGTIQLTPATGTDGMNTQFTIRFPAAQNLAAAEQPAPVTIPLT